VSAFRKRPWLFYRIILFLVPLLFAPGLMAQDADELYVLHFGEVLAIDAGRQEVRECGRLSPAAPTVSRDPQGFLWGRLEPNLFAALDPRTGKIVARIPLRFQPFNHLITPEGKAYITHHTITDRGFTVSVVDTRTRSLVSELAGVAGFRTDLAQAAGGVFLATLGLSGQDYGIARLYRIDTKTDRLQELARASERGWYWKVAVNPPYLFLYCLARPESGLKPRIEVRDLGTLQAVRTLTVEELIGKNKNLQSLWCQEGSGFLLVQGADEMQELVIADGELRGIRKIVKLPRPVTGVVGVVGESFVFLTERRDSSSREALLDFFDFERGKEVKTVSLTSFSKLKS
jgi:hypothetical protein